MGDGTVASASDRPVLEFVGLTKRFGGTLAVDRIDLDVRAGSILALLGENGAGKSTLIKMLAGIHPIDEGEIRFRGAPYRHRPPLAGEAQPIAFIHQDLGLIDWMTVAENMAFGQGFPRRGGLIDWRRARREASKALEAVGGDIDPEARISSLSRTERSLVAIARALAVEAELIVLDEPSASLPANEVARLFTILRRLRDRGTGMIYVSHRLDEVFELADEVAVLRDGRLVGRGRVADTNPKDLIRLIVGRPPEQVFVRPAQAARSAAAEIDGLVSGEAGPVSLRLHQGEMVGLVGLRGAGQEAIGRALFGLAPCHGGSIRIHGEEPDLSTPERAMAAGIGLVAADRTGESLAMPLSVRENLFINPAARGRRLRDWRSPRQEVAEAAETGRRFGVRPNEPTRPVEMLSGGNQQKVVLARWLGLDRRLLILEEPTAGVDVGAKADIYRLLDEALARGLAILVVATDFEEIANICHRALVFSRGAVVAELDRERLSVGSLLAAASAGDHGAAHA
ncbi:MAG: sugar ABC transporter ATP-binding protein [Geminicoccaceae bacterium]